MKKLDFQKDTLSLSMRTKETLIVVSIQIHNYIEAYAKAEGRRVDGKRVGVDYERGRIKSDWLPRRLGGGRGDTRRNREEEKLIRELKRTHPLLRERSRSRERSN